MKPIETRYKGYRFRSRLEARTAVLMDEVGIPYVYEPEGFSFEDGTLYLPDFFLPKQDAFLECKGVMGEKDFHKIELLAKETKKDVVVMNSDMTFEIDCFIEDLSDYLPSDIRKSGIWQSDSWICKCKKCNGVYFGDYSGSWACKCCGYYDGDGGFDVLCHGSRWEQEWNKGGALDKAKSARFEYGESGQ